MVDHYVIDDHVPRLESGCSFRATSITVTAVIQLRDMRQCRASVWLDWHKAVNGGASLAPASHDQRCSENPDLAESGRLPTAYCAHELAAATM
jgi:hypothetical protein